VGAALRFLTVLPVRGGHRAPGRAALVAFPLVGGLVGLVWVAIGLADRFLPIPVLAGLVLVADAVVTGGLHLDALADVTDGAASRRPAGEAVEIMRDPRVGALGALALVLACLLRWSALLPLLGGSGRVLALVAAPVTGRVAMVLLLGILPPRTDGSLAAGVARPSGAVVASACFLGALLSGLPDLRGLAALPAGLAAALVYAAWWHRRFGPLTGDGAGAGGLLAETTALLTLAALAHSV
jgi:adenosylcobinamide-GDP ribazoletransferase